MQALRAFSQCTSFFLAYTRVQVGGGGVSFPLVRTATEVTSDEQYLLIARGSVTSSFRASVWACSSLLKLPAGVSSGFPNEKSCAASLRKDHYHRAKCWDTHQMLDKTHQKNMCVLHTSAFICKAHAWPFRRDIATPLFSMSFYQHASCGVQRPKPLFNSLHLI